VLIDGSTPNPITETLPRYLRALGYVDGSNITFVAKF
jgi:hypothetical protein